MKIFLFGITLLYFGNLWASEVSLKVNLSPAGNFYAKTKDIEGSAKKVGDKVVADNVVVNLKSLKTGIGLRDEHTQKRLETEKYPTAVLLHAEGSGGKGKGRIKIRGIEKDIEGTFEISGSELKAEFSLSIADFKIKDVRYMGAGAKDEVKLQVTIPITGK
jgi:polyisoprenoid-binding protein YceI